MTALVPPGPDATSEDIGAHDLASLAGLDPHLPAMSHVRAAMRAASEAEERAARRRFERAMLGGCRCGEVHGMDECPWCDDDALPVELRAAGAAMRREARVRTAEQEVRDALAKIAEQRPKIELRAPRKPNRFERRRARSRRWRG